MPVATLAGLAAVGLLAALVPLRDLWAVQAVLVAGLLTVPGLLALRALRVPPAATAAFALYVPCTSLVVLSAVGLGVNFAGRLAGMEAPLRPLPLTVGLVVAGLGLIAAGVRAPTEAGVWRPCIPAARELWPLALPVAAAAGAGLLTGGRGPALAIAVAAAAVLMLAWLVIAAPRMGVRAVGIAVYAIALALIWATSLRGELVNGFDIATEIQTMQDTVGNGAWSLDHAGDAYGAMLSLTVLPAVLHSVAGVSVLTLLKVVYPALLALFPVGVLALAARVLTPRFAVLAAGLVLVQAQLFQQLPAIARQEIGLLLFLGLTAAVLDRVIPRPARWSLAAVLAAGLVVSHYSTTYVAIAVLATAVLVQLVVSLFRPVPRADGAIVVALVTLIAGAALWYGPAGTSSADNVTRVAGDFREHGMSLLPNREGGDSPVSAYLRGNTTATLDASDYEAAIVAEYRAERPFVRPLPAASRDEYRLAGASIPGSLPDRPALDRFLGHAELVIAQLVNLLAVLGTAVLLVARRTPPLLRSIAVLGAGVLLVLAFVRLSGTAAVSYNQERVLLQSLVLLAIPAAWLLQSGARRLGRRAWLVGGAAGAGLLVLAVGGTGLGDLATGRSAPLALSATGEDAERFVPTAQERDAALYLDNAAGPGEIVTADRYGQLRVIAATGRTDSLLDDLTPLTIDRDAWVYAGTANVVGGRARGTIGNGIVTFAYPREYLRQNHDLLYVNGSAEVYGR